MESARAVSASTTAEDGGEEGRGAGIGARAREQCGTSAWKGPSRTGSVKEGVHGSSRGLLDSDKG